MRAIAATILAVGWLLAVPGGALGEIVFTDTQFQAETFASGVSQPRDIRFAPGGVFGNDLFVVSNSLDGQPDSGRILTVDTEGSVATWSAGLNGPYGLAFSNGGSFGSYLYVNCEDAPDGICRVDPETKAVSGLLAGIDEGTGIVLNTEGAFGEFLYAAQAKGAGQVNSVYRIGPGFESISFATLGVEAHVNDLTFSYGGAFGSYLYAIARLDPDGDGTVGRYPVQIDSTGQVNVLTEGIPSATSFLLLSPGGIWGEAMYVGSADTIYKISPSWEMSIFAEGFGGLAGMDFAPDGSGLYVAQSGDGGTIVRIVPEPASLLLLAIGALALIRRRGSPGPLE